MASPPPPPAPIAHSPASTAGVTVPRDHRSASLRIRMRPALVSASGRRHSSTARIPFSSGSKFTIGLHRDARRPAVGSELQPLEYSGPLTSGSAARSRTCRPRTSSAASSRRTGKADRPAGRHVSLVPTTAGYHFNCTQNPVDWSDQQAGLIAAPWGRGGGETTAGRALRPAPAVARRHGQLGRARRRCASARARRTTIAMHVFPIDHGGEERLDAPVLEHLPGDEEPERRGERVHGDHGRHHLRSQIHRRASGDDAERRPVHERREERRE